MKQKIEILVKYTPYIILIITTAYLAIQIIHNCGWLYEDVGKIINSVASGRFLALSEYVRFSDARLIPLAAFDYNILLFFDLYKKVTSFYILNTIYFLFFVVSFFFLVRFSLNKVDCSKYNNWISLFAVLYVIQRFYDPVYLQLQYSERIVLPLFLIIILNYISYQKSEKISSALIVILFSVYVTYCKEVNAVVLLVFSLSNLIFNKSLSEKLKTLNWLLVANSLLFLIFYFLIIYPQSPSTYYSGTGMSIIELFKYILWNQKIIIFGVILTLIRLYMLFLNKKEGYIVFDSLLFSGIALFIISVLLKLEYFYYYSPVLVLITPSILYVSKKYFGNIITLAVVIIFFTFYFYKINYSIETIQKRRSEEYVKVESIANYSKSGYDIVWIEVTPLNENAQEVVYRNWARDAMIDHLRFVSRESSFDLNVKDYLDYSHKRVVLFSNLNLKLNKSRSLGLKDELNKQPDFSLGEIEIYIFD